MVLAGAPRPAEAAAFRRHLPISSITLTPQGTGTLIRITYAGRLRVHTRILHSRDAIDALAIGDVDNDGQQDILAARKGGGLVLWRNAGRGHFVFKQVRARRAVTRRETAFHRVLETSAPIQSSDEHCSAAMARAPDAVADPVEAPHVAGASSLVFSAVSACSQGRAPPVAHA